MTPSDHTPADGGASMKLLTTETGSALFILLSATKGEKEKALRGMEPDRKRIADLERDIRLLDKAMKEITS